MKKFISSMPAPIVPAVPCTLKRRRIYETKELENMANYNELVKNRIFIGGAADLSEVLTEKEIDTVIDLRSKTEDTVEAKNIEKIHQPIFDETVNQEEAVQKAIDQVTKAYHEGKNVYFHCAAGQNRTGTVAVGSLLALNKAETIEEAK